MLLLFARMLQVFFSIFFIYLIKWTWYLLANFDPIATKGLNTTSFIIALRIHRDSRILIFPPFYWDITDSKKTCPEIDLILLFKYYDFIFFLLWHSWKKTVKISGWSYQELCYYFPFIIFFLCVCLFYFRYNLCCYNFGYCLGTSLESRETQAVTILLHFLISFPRLSLWQGKKLIV